MNAKDKHRIREAREKILRTWPEIETAPDLDDVLQHLPQAEDVEALLSTIPSEIDLPEFPEDIPEPDYRGMAEYSRRILDAIGDFQGSKSRARNKKFNESRFVKRPSDIAIGGVSLDDFPRCA